MRIVNLLLLLGAISLWAQPPHGTPHGPGGKWWDDPDIVRRFEITADQQKKLDDIFQQNRPRLIDLQAALEKEEVVMEGLMKGPQLDDSKILPAIDRIAQARAELEKTDARMMIAMRHVLTPEQWRKLDEGRPGRPPAPPPREPKPFPPPPRN
jgi:Spy/CpxP family protein refolding chaperone